MHDIVHDILHVLELRRLVHLDALRLELFGTILRLRTVCIAA